MAFLSYEKLFHRGCVWMLFLYFFISKNDLTEHSREGIWFQAQQKWGRM